MCTGVHGFTWIWVWHTWVHECVDDHECMYMDVHGSKWLVKCAYDCIWVPIYTGVHTWVYMGIAIWMYMSVYSYISGMYSGYIYKLYN